MCGAYAATVLVVYLHSLQLLFRPETNGKCGKCEVKIVANQDSFHSTANQCDSFHLVQVHHKALSSDVKATIKERSVHKLTATTTEATGSHLGRRNLNNFVLCSVILGVNGICWSEFGRPALLTHSVGKLCIPCECPNVFNHLFNHLPHGTCFIYFFGRKCVHGCVHMYNYSFISEAFQYWCRKSSYVDF